MHKRGWHISRYHKIANTLGWVCVITDTLHECIHHLLELLFTWLCWSLSQLLTSVSIGTTNASFWRFLSKNVLSWTSTNTYPCKLTGIFFAFKWTNPGLDFTFGKLCMMYFSVHPEELTMKIAQPLCTASLSYGPSQADRPRFQGRWKTYWTEVIAVCCIGVPGSQFFGSKYWNDVPCWTDSDAHWEKGPHCRADGWAIYSLAFILV